MTINQQVGEERLEQILRYNSIDVSQVCIVNWNLRQEVWDWCEKNKIEISYMGSLYSVYDVWQILDKAHMMWFKLRWG